MHNSTSSPDQSVIRDTSPHNLPSQPQNYLSDPSKVDLLNQTTGLELTLEEKDKAIENLQNNVENLEKTIQLLAEAEKSHANQNTLLEAEIAKISSENRLLKQTEQVLSGIIKEEKEDIDVLRDSRKEYLEEYERVNKEKMNLENENVQRWDKIVKLEDEAKYREEIIKKINSDKEILQNELKKFRDGNGGHYYFKRIEELKNANSALKVWLGIAIAIILVLLAWKC